MPPPANNLNFDCDWRFGFNTDPAKKGLVGYVLFWSGCGGLTLPQDIEVWNPFVLAPLDIEPIAASVAKTGRLLVVQECGQTRGLGDRVISLVAQRGLPLHCPPRLISAPDAPIPFAPELELCYRPGAATIATAMAEMLGES